MENEKWRCLKCLSRIELLKKKNKEKPRKKRKLNELTTNLKESSEDGSKITNFLLLYPFYKNQG